VDIQAPGSSITSDWIGGSSATATISGTSMASPHVAGAAALVLGATGGSSLTPAQVGAALINNATQNAVAGLPSGTVNKLLYIGFVGAGGTDTPPPQPVLTATVTKSCSGFSCTLTANVSNAVGTVAYLWSFNDKTSTSSSVNSGTLQRRTDYPYSVRVTADNGSVTVSGSVTCNPRKCQ
jgi:serine protease